MLFSVLIKYLITFVVITVLFRSFGIFLLFSLGITNLSNLVLHDILQPCNFFFFIAAFHIPFSNSVIFIYKPHLYFQIRYSVLMTYWFQISNLLFCLYPFSWVYLSLFSLSQFNTFLVAGTWMFYIFEQSNECLNHAWMWQDKIQIGSF